MKNLLYKIFNLITKIYSRLYWSAKINLYKRKGKNFIFDIKIDDFKYKMTFGDQPITANIVQRIEGRREPETMAIYRSIVTPGMKVVEIGSCYGEFTILLDNLVGDEGKLFAIEGTPNLFGLLKKNFELNKLKNTDIFNLFITNTSENVKFNKNEFHPYKAIERLKKPSQSSEQSLISQQGKKLSSFLDEKNFYPDLIVMDIEGFEVDVIEDLLINKKIIIPKILFEIHEIFYSKTKNLQYLLNLLHINGYRCIKINSNMYCYQ